MAKGMRLTTARYARQSLGGQLRRYSDLDTPTAEQTARMRTLTHGFAVLLGYWKHEFEADALTDLPDADRRAGGYGGNLGITAALDGPGGLTMTRTLERRITALERRRPDVEDSKAEALAVMRRHTMPELRMLNLLIARRDAQPDGPHWTGRQHYDATDRMLETARMLHEGLTDAGAVVTLDAVLDRLADYLDTLAGNILEAGHTPGDLATHTALMRAAEAARPYCPSWAR